MAKPQQAPLIELSTAQIIHSATLKQMEINVAKSEAGRARQRCKELEEQFNGMIAELIGRDALEHGIQLTLPDGSEEE